MTARYFRLVVAMTATAWLMQPDASWAVSLRAGERSGGAAPARLDLDEGKPTLAPFAHVVFCKRYPGECQPRKAGAPLALTPELTAMLRQVNAHVNKSIRPRADTPGPLGDVWTIMPSFGDCDDYAVSKRAELLRRGLPSSALRLLIGRTPRGEGHAALLVRTEKADFVLDNLTPEIRELKKASLIVLKTQSGVNPMRWTGVPGEVVTSSD